MAFAYLDVHSLVAIDDLENLKRSQIGLASSFTRRVSTKMAKTDLAAADFQRSNNYRNERQIAKWARPSSQFPPYWPTAHISLQVCLVYWIS